MFSALLGATLTLTGISSSALSASPMQVRAYVYRTDSCLASIVDHENRAWEPTRYGAGSSYGIPQANPGWKMASAGRDWRTNPWTQLRWMRGYVNTRYHGSCNAWAFWQRNSWY